MERMLATPADAEIILKLYQLRTETVMRQARAWVTGEFWPTTTEDYFAVVGQSRPIRTMPWLRQVLTYWEMAAAMVLHGAVSAELFVDSNAEGFFLLAKFAHILPEIRESESGVPGEDVGTDRIGFRSLPQRYEMALKTVERGARAGRWPEEANVSIFEAETPATWRLVETGPGGA